MLLDPAAPQAFVDETFREDALCGFYVLAAAVLAPAIQADATRAMLGVRGRRGIRNLHWSQMDHAERKAAVTALADVDGFHIAVVGVPVPGRRQERARALCLTALASDLHGHGVRELVIEARTAQLDRRDVATVQGVRYGLPTGAMLWVRHVSGAEQPLLWAADLVAGAVRASWDGEGAYREVLADWVREIRVGTGC